MTELCIEDAAIQIHGAMPAVDEIGGRPVPEAVELEAEYFSQLIFNQQLFERHYRWIVPVLFHYEEFFACSAGGLGHELTAGGAQAHGFFAKYMATGFQGFDGMGGMEAVGGTNAHQVRLLVMEQFRERMVALGSVFAGQPAGFFRVDITDGQQITMAGDLGSVAGADTAASEKGKTVTHCIQERNGFFF